MDHTDWQSVWVLKKNKDEGGGERKRRSRSMGEPTTTKANNQCKSKHNNTILKS